MVTDMTRRVSFLMHDIARRSRYWFDARARSRGLTRAQWRVLLYLGRVDGPTQSEMAEMLDVERITLCRMIDRLADSGLVERRSDPSDRRVWRLHLTDKAMPLVEELGGIADEMEENLLEPLTPEQRETFTSLLTIVRNHMREDNDSPDQAPGQAIAAGGRRG
jgi:MarR family transcriptional regulator, transcriptional regulator for hemolysin